MGGNIGSDVFGLGLEGEGIPVGERIFMGGGLMRGLVLGAGPDGLPGTSLGVGGGNI